MIRWRLSRHGPRPTSSRLLTVCYQQRKVLAELLAPSAWRSLLNCQPANRGSSPAEFIHHQFAYRPTDSSSDKQTPHFLPSEDKLENPLATGSALPVTPLVPVSGFQEVHSSKGLVFNPVVSLKATHCPACRAKNKMKKLHCPPVVFCHVSDQVALVDLNFSPRSRQGQF